MAETLFRLYPFPHRAQPLRATYLSHRLHEIGSASRPFVYGNFVVSLDGRIAFRDPGFARLRARRR